MAAITFTMKAPESIIAQRGLKQGGAVQRVIDSEVLKRSEPYIPKKSGALIASGRSATKIGSGCICYDAPYAAYQYYGVSAKGNPIKYNGAPMRGSYWFERMKAVHINEILRLASNSATVTAVPEKQTVKTVLGNRRNPIFSY